MVAADPSTLFALTTAVFAAATALTGIIMLNSLFKEKLKALFDDAQYFIFFFLISGYTFYAMGEVLWYLITIVFKSASIVGMPDFYWVLGSLFEVIAFFGLAYSLHSFHRDRSKAVLMMIIGIALLVVVLFFVAGLGRTSAGVEQFLTFYYPLSTALIVALSLAVPFFYHSLELVGLPLVLLFVANVVFLAADLSYSVAGTGAFSEMLYTVAYALGAFSFLALLARVHKNHPANEMSKGL